MDELRSIMPWLDGLFKMLVDEAQQYRKQVAAAGVTSIEALPQWMERLDKIKRLALVMFPEISWKILTFEVCVILSTKKPAIDGHDCKALARYFYRACMAYGEHSASVSFIRQLFARESAQDVHVVNESDLLPEEAPIINGDGITSPAGQG